MFMPPKLIMLLAKECSLARSIIAPEADPCCQHARLCPLCVRRWYHVNGSKWIYPEELPEGVVSREFFGCALIPQVEAMMKNQQRCSRRVFLGACMASVAVSGVKAARAEGGQPVRKETATYKEVDGLKIGADLHRPNDQILRPVVVWIHGGALINGHRGGVNERVKRMVLDSGYALVSIDYRLAPETRLPFIIEDVQDALAWLRGDGSRRWQLDANRLAVMGESAGGYLALTTGYRVQPRPKALVSFWGYCDLIGDWYSRPSPHPRHHRVQLTQEQAEQQVDGPPIADSRDRQGDGGAFYQHCRQHGTWPDAVSGWNPRQEPEKFFRYMPVRNVSTEFRRHCWSMALRIPTCLLSSHS